MSDIVRWSMDLRYQSARLPTNARITRLPEEAVPAPEDGVPPACYPPEADFLVRSRQRPKALGKSRPPGLEASAWAATRRFVSSTSGTMWASFPRASNCGWASGVNRTV